MQIKISEPQCLKCCHNIKNTACGSCGDEELINKNVINASVKSADKLLKTEDLEFFKYSCKVVMNSPEDFNVVDPLKCRYFLPSVLKLY